MPALIRSLLAAFLLIAVGGLHAQERTSPTLERIRANGGVYVGYQERVPFAYRVEGQIVGHSMDLCRHLVNAIKAQLGLPELKVVEVPVTAASRQMMFEAGTLDLDCGPVTNTRQAQGFVAFSVSTQATGIKLLVRSDSGIRSLRDMQGKRVVTVVGTNAEAYVRAAAARQGVNPTYRLGRDADDALRQLQNAQADALVADNVQLHVLLMNMAEADAGTLTVLPDDVAVEPGAIMLRRKDPLFKQLIDQTLIGLMKTGEFSRIYEQWFMAPIPLNGKNSKSLMLPMSDWLRQLTLTPNDSGL